MSSLNLLSPLSKDNKKINNIEDWVNHRPKIKELLFEHEYGPIPPKPIEQKNDLLHPTKRFKKYPFEIYNISFPDGPFVNIQLEVTYPEGDGPFPVIINGDGCWKYLNDDIIQECLDNNYIIAHFNRTTVARDINNDPKENDIYPFYPDLDFGAVAAWAWAYHRCIDFLSELDTVDLSKITLSGHSRGGKAVLLAGATDERVSITNPNNSGCGGAGSFKFQAPESEELKQILNAFPHWFCKKLQTYIDKQDQLPFDQHFLKALVAPRALLCTEALGDLWANPKGTSITNKATEEVYELYNKTENINIYFREGQHAHGHADWKVLLDFCNHHFFKTKTTYEFNKNPFN